MGLILAVAVLCAATPFAFAQSATVEEILIQGSQRIEPETVRAYLKVKEGDPMDARLVDDSLKALYATGMFADVSIRKEGGRLVIVVVENPIINNLAFEGNTKLKDDMLTTEVQLKPRTVFTRTKVQNDVKRILELYRRAGRFDVSVDPKVISRDQNRIDLVFEINEGPPTYVQKINIIGNREFTDGELLDVLMTKEDRWYRVFSSNSTFDPDRLTYDRELLRRHYLSEGYADFRVNSAVAELTPDRQGFYITISVDEGSRYKFGKLTVEAALEQLKGEDLQSAIVPVEGDWYDSNLVEKSIQGITEKVGQLGYAFVEVRPGVDRDKENGLINVAFDVQEGPRVFVERIDITGNVRTLDEVVRREFRLVEGDAFNSAKMRRSQERINNLAFFEKVDITNVPSETAPDRTIVQVNVQEKSTGELSFGVGYSSNNGPMFDVGIRERNLLGRGQDLKAKFQISAKHTQGDFSFTEPYFLDRELAAGADLFSTSQDMQTESSYNNASMGGGLRLGFSYTEELSHTLRYTGKTTKIKKVSDNASKYIKASVGTSTVSSFGHALIYDTRDNHLSPSSGMKVRLANEIAGAGGSEKFFQTDLGVAQHYSPFEEWILSLKANGGHVFGLGQDVGLSQRYTLGGDTLRGFENSGVSPRDISTKDALGGNWIAYGGAQMDFPIGLPNEFGITGRVFSDLGTIGSPDNIPAADMNDSQKVRMSVGWGVAWKSPVGPLSLDFGFPIVQESYDKTEVFRVNFGSRF